MYILNAFINTTLKQMSAGFHNNDFKEAANTRFANCKYAKMKQVHDTRFNAELKSSHLNIAGRMSTEKNRSIPQKRLFFLDLPVFFSFSDFSDYKHR